MSNSVASLKIINLTPLPLEAHWKGTVRDFAGTMNVRVNAMPLTPFVPVDYPWDETGVIRVSLPGQQQFSQGKFLTPPNFSVFTHEIPKDPSVSIFTIDMAFVRNLLRATPSYEAFAARVAEHSRVFHKEWGHQLKVINNTDLVAEAYLLGVKGRDGLAR